MSWLNKYIYSFHVCFFFVLSGITFKIVKYNKYSDFFKDKFKKIMIPYFIFAVLFLIPYLFLGMGVASDLNRTDIKFDITKSIIGIFYGNGHDNFLRQNSALWFLPCLFVVEIIYYFVEKSKYEHKHYIAIIMSLIFGALDYYFLPIRLPWGFDIALTMISFFAIGKIIGNCLEKKEYQLNTFKEALKSKTIFNPWFAILAIILGALLQAFNSKVSYMHNSYGIYPLFFIAACFSVLGYIGIIRLLPPNKFLEYAGKRTLAILIFHKLIVVLFQTKIKFIAKMLKNGSFLLQFTSATFIVIVAILISLLIELIVAKLFPFMLGMKKEYQG